MGFSEITFFIIFLIPMYGLLMWTYFEPEESLLLGKRWMFNAEPELSPKVIRYTKFSAMCAMVGIPLFIFAIFTNILVIRVLIPMILIFVFLIGVYKIFIAEEPSD